MSLKVLIIEDSTSLRRSLKIGLSNLGYTVDDTGDGDSFHGVLLSGVEPPALPQDLPQTLLLEPIETTFPL